MALLHEFYSEDDCSRGLASYRKATVFQENDGSFTVYMMQDGAIIEERNIKGQLLLGQEQKNNLNNSSINNHNSNIKSLNNTVKQ